MDLKRILAVLAIALAVACEETKLPPTESPPIVIEEPDPTDGTDIPPIEEPTNEPPREPDTKPTEPVDPPTEPPVVVPPPDIPEEPGPTTPPPVVDPPPVDVPIDPVDPPVQERPKLDQFTLNPSGTNIAISSADYSFKLVAKQGARPYAFWLKSEPGQMALTVDGKTTQVQIEKSGWQRAGDFNLNWSSHEIRVEGGLAQELIVTEDLKWAPEPPVVVVPPTPPPVVTPPAPLEPSNAYDLKVTSKPYVPTAKTKAAWTNLLYALEHPNKEQSLNISLSAKEDAYAIGRGVQQRMMTFSHAIRMTHDKRFADAAFEILTNVKANIKYNVSTSVLCPRTEKSKYLSLLYNNPLSDGEPNKFAGGDCHLMDNSMSAATMAHGAYILHLNRGIDSRYGALADFYKDFLINHFEAQWRTGGKGFLNANTTDRNYSDRIKYPTPHSAGWAKELTHPYLSWIKYHLMISKLFKSGENPKVNPAEYEKAAKAMWTHAKATAFKEIDTPSGKGYVWAHSVDVNQSENKACQMAVYTSISLPNLSELYFFGIVSKDELQKVENNFAHHELTKPGERKYPALNGDVCGNVARGGLKPMKDGYICNGKDVQEKIAGQICTLQKYDNQSQGNSIKRTFHLTLWLDKSGVHQKYLDYLKTKEAAFFKSVVDTPLAEFIKAAMSDETAPVIPTPKPEEPTPPPTAESVDISKCTVTGSDDLKRVLTRTGGYTGTGGCTLTVKSNSSLPSHSVKITHASGNFLIEGNAPNSAGAQWAASEFLHEYVGVRWPFPGLIGEYVPQMSKVLVPKKNYTYNKLLIRSDFRQSGRPAAIIEWLEKRHYVEKTRSEGTYGHQYTKLAVEMGIATPIAGTDDYKFDWSKDPKNIFAVDPTGRKVAWAGDATRLKINPSNSAVDEMIKADYIKLGKPKFYSNSASDSSGYDTSDKSMTDIWGFPLTAENKTGVWRGSYNLSDGFLRRGKRTYNLLKEIRPDVEMSWYVYASYKRCPTQITPQEYGLKSKTVVQMVPGNWYESDLAEWTCWADYARAQMLRPNWSWNVNMSPRYNPTSMGKYLDFAAKNGMRGFDMDSYNHAPAVNGPYNYLIASKMRDPLKPSSEIHDEYVSSFGVKAKPFVAAALKLQEKASEEYGIPERSGQEPTGAYLLAKNARLPFNYLAGSYFSLPLGWPDSKVNPIIAEWKKALAVATGDDKARVQFVLDGWGVFILFRDMMYHKGQACFNKKLVSEMKLYEAKLAQYLPEYHKVYGTPTSAENKFNTCNLPDQTEM